MSGAAAVRVQVPATSANLGPGFDALALALDLCDEIEAEVTDSGLDIRIEGEGAGEVPADETHLVVRAFDLACDRLGVRRTGLRLRCRNRIPHGRGLGSSAAATVAGILLARGLLAPELSDDQVLSLASAMEGHPDNAAACLLGGVTIAWSDGQGVHGVRTEPDADLQVLALVPPTTLATEAARALLPPQVPHADAAFTAGRAALLVEALTRRPELLLAATDDRLHQHYRAPAMPETAETVRRLRAAGLAAVVSGAGPSVLVLAGRRTPDVTDLVPDGWAAHGWAEPGRPGAQVHRL